MKKRKRLEVDEEEDLDLQSVSPIVPLALSMLCMWAKDNLVNGGTINCTLDERIFGHPRKVYIFKHDINSFVTMKEVSGNCIAMYMR